jgi:ABC-type oligopeptide transport system substrate-binding subunit
MPCVLVHKRISLASMNPVSYLWLLAFVALVFPVLAPAEPLKIGCPNQFSPLDPKQSSALQNRMTLGLVYETLVRMNGKQELEGVLASSWTVADDGRSLRMVLRKNARFSDGAPVTAQAVKDSFAQICVPQSPVVNDIGGLVGCKQGKIEQSVKTVGPTTIEFSMDASPTLFLYQLASPRTGIVRYTEKGQLGSGPYQIERQSPDEVVLSKNPQYWAPQKVKNDGLVLKYLDETKLESSVSAYKPDATLMFRVATIEGLKLDGYRIVDEASNITLKLMWNNQRFPFDQPIVRRAIQAQIYNDDAVRKCLLGDNRRAYGIIPIGMGGSRAHVAPDRMEEIPSEEVFKKVPKLKRGVNVTIHRHVGRKNDCEENAIAGAMSKYGVHAQFQHWKSYSDLWPAFLSHKLDAFIELFVYENREAYSKLIYYLSDGVENFPNLKASELDGMIRASWQSTTAMNRFKQYGAINDYIVEHANVVPLYYTHSRNLVHRCLKNIPEDFLFNPFFGLWQVQRDPKCR